jgi:putative transposase
VAASGAPLSLVARPNVLVISSSGTSTRALPTALWVSDFAYVATWSGVIYVAFAIDAFSRRIVGWKVDSTMKTPLVLDTLEMALWARDHHGQPVSEGLVLHSDAGSQGGFNWCSQRLTEGGCDGQTEGLGFSDDGAAGDAVAGAPTGVASRA